MNKHVQKLVAFTETGADSHLVADSEIGSSTVLVMTLCGKVIEPSVMLDLPHNQVSCGKCRKSSAKYGHKVGKVS